MYSKQLTDVLYNWKMYSIAHTYFTADRLTTQLINVLHSWQMYSTDGKSTQQLSNVLYIWQMYSTADWRTLQQTAHLTDRLIVLICLLVNRCTEPNRYVWDIFYLLVMLSLLRHYGTSLTSVTLLHHHNTMQVLTGVSVQSQQRCPLLVLHQGFNHKMRNL